MQPPAREALLHLIAISFRCSAWPKQSTGLGARSAASKPQRMRIKKPPRAPTLLDLRRLRVKSRQLPCVHCIGAWTAGRCFGSNQEEVWSKGELF